MSCAFPISGFLLTKTVLEWKLIQLAVLRALHHLRILVTWKQCQESELHMKLEREQATVL